MKTENVATNKQKNIVIKTKVSRKLLNHHTFYSGLFFMTFVYNKYQKL